MPDNQMLAVCHNSFNAIKSYIITQYIKSLSLLYILLSCKTDKIFISDGYQLSLDIASLVFNYSFLLFYFTGLKL